MAARQQVTAEFLAELAGVSVSTVREDVRLLRLIIGKTAP
jgi:predicted DNA-binding transcriptional regulator YafY